ncbi:hypothetical protein B0H16DRAFT_1343631 [Mycena metata]|uniref:Uncharacterized protein n=1 Tax=Mycena metata TaxID=1033252 RepID=A0AAD7H4A6_9AGAR|nr:hypothetical protein B0H16DRAFT_1343631 [Mycena metata]
MVGNAQDETAAPASGVNRKGWGKWMSDGYTILERCPGGEDWHKALELWTDLERTYGFKSSPKALSKEGRPDAVSTWTKYGRRTDKAPALKVPVDEFATQWWAWWAALAPLWRATNAQGRLQPGDDAQGADGPWEGLVHPGANGILIVLLTLAWWREEEGEESETWSSAVQDVKWVLGGLLINAR